MARVLLIAGLAILVLDLTACQSGNDGSTLRPGGAGAQYSIQFFDVTQWAGLGGFLQENGNREKRHIVETVGGGGAFLDYDNDGDLDVYFTNGSSLEGFPPGQEPRDALYRNNGNGTFTDVTAQAKLGDKNWTCGVAVADYDNDGWSDLYLTNFGPNVLYHNNGNGTFSDVTNRAGVGDPHWSTGACFFDYDTDGDLDLYVANYVEFDKNYRPDNPEFCQWHGVMVMYGPRGLEGAADKLYRNDGNGTFTDVTRQAGIVDPGYYGFQAVTLDYDDDGDLDVYVANDSTPNLLWRNNGNGTFTEVGLAAGVALSEKGKEQGSMGVTVGDYNGDGRFDLFVTNFSEDYYTLYRADGNGFFTDVTSQSGLAEATYLSLGWGCDFFDYDNDGDVDLFAANGHVYPQVDRFDLGIHYRQKNQLFENLGNGRFNEVTSSAGPGLLIEKCSRGAAFGDFDNDGDIDILTSNLDDHPTLLRNDGGNQRNWINVRLIGTKTNRDAVGAKVTVVAGGRKQVRWVVSGTSFLSANDPRIHFGLGDQRQIDELEVIWPGGTVEQFVRISPNQLITVTEGTGIWYTGGERRRRKL